MIGNIVFWLLVVMAVVSTFGCICTPHGKTMLFSVVVLWAIAILFWVQKDISRLHILWVTPVLITVEALVEMSIRRKLRDRAINRKVETMIKKRDDGG
jgi:hypothetical protein